jgi:hypothetical protein
MTFARYHCVGLEYLIIGPERWEREHATNFWFSCYEVLDLQDAARALREMAFRDVRLLHALARDVLGYAYQIACGGHRASADERVLDALDDRLGVCRGRGRPPELAWIYVCRRKKDDVVHQPASDPWRRTREAVAAAERAPRGYVIVEAVTDTGAPVPHLRLEVLLADGTLLSRATDGSGRLHLEPVPQGRCHIRVVDLDGSAWRPADGEASSCVERSHKRVHIVFRGENLTRIARQYAVRSWATLWNAADNEQLRKRRKNPNRLLPGDEVVVPGIQIHAISRPTDATHRIVIGSERAVVALLNAHLLQVTADVGVHWSNGSSTLGATSALFRDATSASLRLNDVREQAVVALVAPVARASEDAATTAPSGTPARS